MHLIEIGISLSLNIKERTTGVPSSRYECVMQINLRNTLAT